MSTNTTTPFDAVNDRVLIEDGLTGSTKARAYSEVANTKITSATQFDVVSAIIGGVYINTTNTDITLTSGQLIKNQREAKYSYLFTEQGWVERQKEDPFFVGYHNENYPSTDEIANTNYFESKVGIKTNMISNYQGFFYYNNTKFTTEITPILNSNRSPMIFCQCQGDIGTLGANTPAQLPKIINGDYDIKFQLLCTQIENYWNLPANKNREFVRTYLHINHEIQLNDTYQLSFNRSGPSWDSAPINPALGVNNPADWKLAQERISGIIQGTDAWKKGFIKIGFGLAEANGGNATGNNNFDRISKYFPVRSSYDFVGLDVYDRYAAPNQPSFWTASFEFHCKNASLQVYKQIIENTNAQIIICETATGRFNAANTLKTKYSGNVWIKDMFSSIVHNLKQIKGVIYFGVEIGTSVNWKIPDSELVAQSKDWQGLVNKTIENTSQERVKKNELTKDTTVLSNWLQAGTAQGVLTQSTSSTVATITSDNLSKSTKILKLTNPTQSTGYSANMQNYMYFTDTTATVFEGNVPYILQFEAFSNVDNCDLMVGIMDDSNPSDVNLRGFGSFVINKESRICEIGITTGISPTNLRFVFGIGANAVGTELYLDAQNIKFTKGDVPPVFGNVASSSSVSIPVPFVSLTSVVSPSTIVENPLLSTVGAKGSIVLSANSIAVNDIYKVEVYARYTTSATPPQLTLRLKLGALIVLNPDPVAITLPASQTNRATKLTYLVAFASIGASGLVRSSLESDIITNQTITGSDPIDTTVSTSWAFTSQWTTAPSTDVFEVRSILITKI